MTITEIEKLCRECLVAKRFVRVSGLKHAHTAGQKTRLLKRTGPSVKVLSEGVGEVHPRLLLEWLNRKKKCLEC